MLVVRHRQQTVPEEGKQRDCATLDRGLTLDIPSIDLEWAESFCASRSKQLAVRSETISSRMSHRNAATATAHTATLLGSLPVSQSHTHSFLGGLDIQLTQLGTSTLTGCYAALS